MLTLIRKDLLLHKTAFYGYMPVLVVYLAYLASEVSRQNVFITFTGIMVAILPMILIAREDKFGAEAFICSLPVTRRQVVHAKYVMCWSVALVLTMIGLALYSIFGAEGHPTIWRVPSAGRVLLILSLGLGAGLPLALRFGWIGLVGGLVGIQILGVVAYLALETLATDLRLVDVFRGVSNGIDKLHSGLGGPLFLAVVMVVLVIFNLASCRIGVALFERREW